MRMTLLASAHRVRLGTHRRQALCCYVDLCNGQCQMGSQEHMLKLEVPTSATDMGPSGPHGELVQGHVDQGAADRQRQQLGRGHQQLHGHQQLDLGRLDAETPRLVPCREPVRRRDAWQPDRRRLCRAQVLQPARVQLGGGEELSLPPPGRATARSQGFFLRPSLPQPGRALDDSARSQGETSIGSGSGRASRRRMDVIHGIRNAPRYSERLYVPEGSQRAK